MCKKRQRKNQRCRVMRCLFASIGLAILLCLFLDSDFVMKKASASQMDSSGEWRYELDEDGHAVIIEYCGNKEEVVLAEEMDGHEVVAVGLPEYHTVFDATLKKITLPDTLTSIGVAAFSGCSSLRSVDFPAALKSIDREAFAYCHSLAAIQLPTGLETIDSSVFMTCENLISIGLDDGNQHLQLDNGVLYNRDKTEAIMACDKKIETLNISKGVKKIHPRAFERCEQLQSVCLPDSLQYIGDWAFAACYSLQTYTIPKGVTEIGEYILYNCISLTQLKVMGPVGDLNDICNSCVNLNKVFLAEGVKTISGFTCCYRLKSITLPESAEVIKADAFNSTAISSITIPSGITHIEEGGLSISSLKDITVAEGNPHFYMRPEGLYNDRQTLLATTVLSGEISISKECRRIGAKACWERDNIEKVNIPDTVTEIGEYAFQNCTGLGEVNLGSQLTSLGGEAFYNTKYLKDEMELEEGVYYLGNYAISYVAESSQEVLKIRNGCTLIAGNCFVGRESIKYVWLPDSLKYIGKQAFWCDSIQKIIGGCSLVSIGEQAFYGNTSLKGVFLRGEKITIEKGAFAGCWNMSEFVVDAQEVVLAENCFASGGHKMSLSLLVLPNLNISLYSMGLSDIQVRYTTLALTNMPAEALNHQESLFADCRGLQLYLSLQSDELAWGDRLTEEGISVYYADKYHLCQFVVYGIMEKICILPDGGVLIPPITEGENYTVTPVGPLLADIQWDLNGDGSADKLPEKVHGDIRAEALYHIQETEHNWAVKEIFQELTCTQDGDILYFCVGCGVEKQVKTEAKGHDFSKEWITDEVATCTENGVKSHHCTREGCTGKDSQTLILATGHDWGGGIITKDPQMGMEGERTFTCANCHEQRRITMAALPLVTATPDAYATVKPEKSAMPSKSALPTTPVASPSPSSGDEKTSITLQAKSDYSKINLKWTARGTSAQYWLYRSEKKNGKKKLLKKIEGNQITYSDKRVAAGKNYYYQVKVMHRKKGYLEVSGVSNVCKASLKVRKAPIVKIKKKRDKNIRYLEIVLKRYTGNRLEIYYRKKKTNAFQKLKLHSDKIPQSKTMRIKYLSKGGKLYFRFRTFNRNKGVRIYSRYTSEKRIVI